MRDILHPKILHKSFPFLATKSFFHTTTSVRVKYTKDFYVILYDIFQIV